MKKDSKDDDEGVFLQLSRDEAYAVAVLLGKNNSTCCEPPWRWGTAHIREEILVQLGHEPDEPPANLPCKVVRLNGADRYKNIPTLIIMDND